jgi:hypothetical protein
VVKDEGVISKERAVELVESQLAKDRLAWSMPHELAIFDVTEHPVGWLVHWNTAEYIRTGDSSYRLGGGGPYLVDRYDGSIHCINITTWVAEDWEALYLREIKGIKPSTPDPLAAAVRALVRDAGTVAAMRHLRRQAPRVNLRQAKAYVAAVQDGAEPPEELAVLTREEKQPLPLGISTLAGPLQ